jgi:hypothetical protein
VEGSGLTVMSGAGAGGGAVVGVVGGADVGRACGTRESRNRFTGRDGAGVALRGG